MPTRFRILHAGRSVLLNRTIWRRALPIGLTVGLAQAAVNQGDHWLQHQITTAVVIKTILSPLITLVVAFGSAVATHLELHRSHPSS